MFLSSVPDTCRPPTGSIPRRSLGRSRRYLPLSLTPQRDYWDDTSSTDEDVPLRRRGLPSGPVHRVQRNVLFVVLSFCRRYKGTPPGRRSPTSVDPYPCDVVCEVPHGQYSARHTCHGGPLHVEGRTSDVSSLTTRH